MLNLATIGIENAIAEIGFRVGRVFNQQNLVSTDAKLAMGQGTCPFRGHFNGLANAIDNDKVIARAMHFCKLPNHRCLMHKKTKLIMD